MYYSSFPGRIYVEKTPEQWTKSPLPLENQGAVREEVETQSTRLDDRQVDDKIEQ